VEQGSEGKFKVGEAHEIVRLKKRIEHLNPPDFPINLEGRGFLWGESIREGLIQGKKKLLVLLTLMGWGT